MVPHPQQKPPSVLAPAPAGCLRRRLISNMISLKVDFDLSSASSSRLRHQLVSPPLPTASRPNRLLAAATAVSLQLVSPSRSILTASHRPLFASQLGGPCFGAMPPSSVSALSAWPSGIRGR
ncbi:hypothetical protein PIB30_028373 [Stylosanthes scabra]|uniref:Uncharacterized protein n=1 Tax=Stylosanthes scabra TaxID=79078 RepID=A0ABU6SAZ7_9FABA|nr:hypothetical protein [Stylosanthes scabra]